MARKAHHSYYPALDTKCLQMAVLHYLRICDPFQINFVCVEIVHFFYISVQWAVHYLLQGWPFPCSFMASSLAPDKQVEVIPFLWSVSCFIGFCMVLTQIPPYFSCYSVRESLWYCKLPCSVVILKLLWSFQNVCISIYVCV